VQPGDLVKSAKHHAIGIVVEVFDDLDQNNPWIRVLFTHPQKTYQWCKKNGLVPCNEMKDEDPPPSDPSGSS